MSAPRNRPRPRRAMRGGDAPPPALGEAKVYFAGRLAPGSGRFTFGVALVFAVPAVFAAAALAVDLGRDLAAGVETGPDGAPAWLRALAVLLFVAFAGFAAKAAFDAYRMIGARYWVVEEGLFLASPERLIVVPAGARIEAYWKKSAGAALRIDDAGEEPPFLFLPGLALKLGQRIVLYSVALGTDIDAVGKALSARKRR